MKGENNVIEFAIMKLLENLERENELVKNKTLKMLQTELPTVKMKTKEVKKK